MRSIEQYFDFLYSLERISMKYDLSNIKTFLNVLSNPQRKFKSIHIAGTNGKGATASFAASILMEAGYKTGLFTSPHILRFNERIRVNGKTIPDSYIKTFLNTHNRLIMKIKPSFFEVNTAMAFQYFSDKKVEIAVIEAGLGGRLDSTNIIKPSVSVITQIGMDHMQYLGNTLRQIAKEKIGIVKEDVKTIVSDNNESLKKLFASSISKEQFNYLSDSVRITNAKNTPAGTKFTLLYKDGSKYKMLSPLLGDYQMRNAAAGILAVKMFTNDSLRSKDVTRGVAKVKENTGYKARLETIEFNGVKYIFDISHNPDGIAVALKHLRGSKIDTVVFAIMADKDYKSSLKLVCNYFKNIIFTRPEYKRSLEPKVLLKYSNILGVAQKQKIVSAGNVREAIEVAQTLENNGKPILVIGSFFLVSDVIRALKIEKLFR